MKKLIIAILAMSLGSFSIASAEVGVNIGVSGQMGVFAANGLENEDTQQHRSATTTLVGYSSVFLEKTLGSRLSIGIDYVPSALESETASRTDVDNGAAVTQKVQADFEDLTTIYATLNITDNFFVKGGMVTVDVITKESLGTGSTYPNTTLDGTMFGAGYNYDFDNGMFIRAEGNVMMMDGVTLTSTAAAVARPGTAQKNFVKLDNLNGANAKVSIGKSF
tara:strand:+ start:547 stop:1209 length:663 start_codon:yes stop_codon:yes gene_type:complete